MGPSIKCLISRGQVRLNWDHLLACCVVGIRIHAECGVGRRLDLSELEKSSADDPSALVAEIPSDGESIHSDCDSNDEEHLENNAVAPAVDDLLVYDQNELLAVTNDEDLSWDSEDELPLTTFLPVVNVLSQPTFQW
ncbi:hypothetical protein JTB14_026368 [Gonioctena quinquepunctata]|nr:hypothetical protein JTB14_026368 [Gonioctena quinquepunctata]